MSQIFNASLLTPESVRAIVGTSVVPLVTTNNPLPLGKIHLCNVTNAAITFDLEVLDEDGTSYFMEKGRTLPANSSHEVRDEVIQAGETLRAKSSVAASLHVHIIKAIVTR